MEIVYLLPIGVAYNKMYMMRQFPCEVYVSHDLHEKHKMYTAGCRKGNYLLYLPCFHNICISQTFWKSSGRYN